MLKSLIEQEQSKMKEIAKTEKQLNKLLTEQEELNESISNQIHKLLLAKDAYFNNFKVTAYVHKGELIIAYNYPKNLKLEILNNISVFDTVRVVLEGKSNKNYLAIKRIKEVLQ